MSRIAIAEEDREAKPKTMRRMVEEACAAQ